MCIAQVYKADSTEYAYVMHFFVRTYERTHMVKGGIMWKYIRRYLPYAVLAGLFMIGEVLMDLIQPGVMSRIVDEGGLGLNNGGVSNLNLIWKLGFRLICLVVFGGLCGSLNNVFVHLSGQNIGNEMRKDCFRKIMTFF